MKLTAKKITTALAKGKRVRRQSWSADREIGITHDEFVLYKWGYDGYTEITRFIPNFEDITASDWELVSNSVLL